MILCSVIQHYKANKIAERMYNKHQNAASISPSLPPTPVSPLNPTPPTHSDGIGVVVLPSNCPI